MEDEMENEMEIGMAIGDTKDVCPLPNVAM